MTARNRVVREPYATWCGRTPVEIIHGLLPDYLPYTTKGYPYKRTMCNAYTHRIYFTYTKTTNRLSALSSNLGALT